jgi:hypothetical protein
MVSEGGIASANGTWTVDFGAIGIAIRHPINAAQ